MNKTKLKTRKSVARRFKITKTGKVLFGHQYSSHNKSKKSNKRIRRQNVPGQLTGIFAKKMKRLLALG